MGVDVVDKPNSKEKIRSELEQMLKEHNMRLVKTDGDKTSRSYFDYVFDIEKFEGKKTEATGIINKKTEEVEIWRPIARFSSSYEKQFLKDEWELIIKEEDRKAILPTVKKIMEKMNEKYSIDTTIIVNDTLNVGSKVDSYF